MRRSFIDRHTPTLMVIPMLLIIVVFLGFLVYVLGLSVTNSTLAKPFNGFIGFANYAKAFNDAIFGQSLKYMLLFAIVVTFVETVLGFLFALALYTAVTSGRFIRTIALLPLFAPAVAIGMLWKLVYDPGSGFLNHYLLQMGHHSGSNWIFGKLEIRHGSGDGCRYLAMDTFLFPACAWQPSKACLTIHTKPRLWMVPQDGRFSAV